MGFRTVRSGTVLWFPKEIIWLWGTPFPGVWQKRHIVRSSCSCMGPRSFFFQRFFFHDSPYILKAVFRMFMVPFFFSYVHYFTPTIVRSCSFLYISDVNLGNRHLFKVQVLLHLSLMTELVFNCGYITLLSPFSSIMYTTPHLPRTLLHLLTLGIEGIITQLYITGYYFFSFVSSYVYYKSFSFLLPSFSVF